MTRAPGKAERLVAAFEDAVNDHVFLGTIPDFSPDPEEQQAIDRERRRIQTNYTRTRNRLIKALEIDQ